MKKTMFSMAVIFLILASACNKDNDDDNNQNPPQEVEINFNINQNDHVAPATISTENLTTGYTGNYEWIVQPEGIVAEEFTSSDINYIAEYPGNYEIKLIAGKDTLVKSFNLTAPTFVEVDRLTLTNVSNTYSSIYFVLKAFENSTFTTLFTSSVRNNVTPSSVATGNEYWTFQAPFNQFEIQNQYGGPSYFIEFYDGNDNVISKLNPYIPFYLSNYGRYTEEEITLSTSNITCSGCDYIEVSTNISFTNY